MVSAQKALSIVEQQQTPFWDRLYRWWEEAPRCTPNGRGGGLGGAQCDAALGPVKQPMLLPSPSDTDGSP